MTLNQVQARQWLSGRWRGPAQFFCSLFILFFVFFSLFFCSYFWWLETRFSVLRFFVLIFCDLKPGAGQWLSGRWRGPGQLVAQPVVVAFQSSALPLVHSWGAARNQHNHTTLKTYFYLPARLTDSQVPPPPPPPHPHHHHPPPPLMAIIRRHFTTSSSSREGLAAAIDGLCRQSRLYVIVFVPVFVFVFVSVFCICLGLLPFLWFAFLSLLLWECLVQPREQEGPK